MFIMFEGGGCGCADGLGGWGFGCFGGLEMLVLLDLGLLWTSC